MDFDTQYEQLEVYLKGIKNKFLDSHLANPLSSPEQYDLDVKSYCILCHAAFEEFVELLSLRLMSKSIENYTLLKKITLPIVSLMHFKGNHNNYLEKEIENLSIEDIEKIYDYNRTNLEEIKSKFSNEIYNNHGISLKYMRKLLMPVSIDIPQDVNWANSLQKLADERGAYAHKFLEKGKVRQSIEPEEAKDIVQDCLALCGELKERAKKRLE